MFPEVSSGEISGARVESSFRELDWKILDRPSWKILDLSSWKILGGFS
jgi:hypothetical protein